MQGAEFTYTFMSWLRLLAADELPSCCCPGRVGGAHSLVVCLLLLLLLVLSLIHRCCLQWYVRALGHRLCHPRRIEYQRAWAAVQVCSRSAQLRTKQRSCRIHQCRARHCHGVTGLCLSTNGHVAMDVLPRQEGRGGCLGCFLNTCMCPQVAAQNKSWLARFALQVCWPRKVMQLAGAWTKASVLATQVMLIHSALRQPA